MDHDGGVFMMRRAVAGGVHRLGEHVNRHFAVVGALALAVAIAGFVALAHVLVSAQLRTTEDRAATQTSVVLARSAFETAVGADSDALNKAEIRRLDAATAGARSAQGLLSLTVFRPSGRVLYSPKHSLIGTQQSFDHYDRAALAGRSFSTPPHNTTDRTDLSGAERIDVYVPLKNPRGRVAALFELSLPYTPIASRVATETRQIDVALLIAGLLIFLLAVPRLRHAGAALRTVTAQQHRALVRELREAIDDGQLRLEYQPLAHLRTGHVRAVEALLRWDHPRRGLIPPLEFIPQIEQTSLIWPLTEHVLKLAIAQTAVWREDGLDLRVSVNVPAACLLDRRLPGTVSDLLHGAGLPADRLAIELTEESVIREPQLAIEALAELRALGIEMLAIDDFGTGYSSLTRLRELPITGLKIDRSFVADASLDGDPTLIAAIADLAHKFGLAVVAEGIEDEATWKLMAALGCDVGQGYWLSRPLRSEVVLDWMRGRKIEQWPQPTATAEIESASNRPRKQARRRRTRTATLG
jgi:EAL domain-containing protein (putative c-di-GMP-specific phosphodiesterase class I)